MPLIFQDRTDDRSVVGRVEAYTKLLRKAAESQTKNGNPRQDFTPADEAQYNQAKRVSSGDPFTLIWKTLKRDVAALDTRLSNPPSSWFTDGTYTKYCQAIHRAKEVLARFNTKPQKTGRWDTAGENRKYKEFTDEAKQSCDAKVEAKAREEAEAEAARAPARPAPSPEAAYDRHAETEDALRYYGAPDGAQPGGIIGPLDGRDVPPGTPMRMSVRYSHRAGDWVEAFGDAAPRAINANGRFLQRPAQVPGGESQPFVQALNRMNVGLTAMPLFDAVINDSRIEQGGQLYVVDGANIFHTKGCITEFDKHKRIEQWLPGAWNRSNAPGPVVVVFKHEYLWEGFLRRNLKKAKWDNKHNRWIPPCLQPERNSPEQLAATLELLYTTLEVLHRNMFPVQFIDLEPKKCQDQDPDPVVAAKRSVSPNDDTLPEPKQEEKYPCHDTVFPEPDRPGQDPYGRYPNRDPNNEVAREQVKNAGLKRPEPGHVWKSVCQVARLPGDVQRGITGRLHHRLCEYDDVVLDALVYYARHKKYVATRISGDQSISTDLQMIAMWDAMQQLRDRMWLRTFLLEPTPQQTGP